MDFQLFLVVKLKVLGNLFSFSFNIYSVLLDFADDKKVIKNNGGGGGGPTPFLPMGKLCVFPFFPMGKNGEKVYGKRGKRILFPLFPYTFFPMGKNREKWEKTHFSHGQKWG